MGLISRVSSRTYRDDLIPVYAFNKLKKNLQKMSSNTTPKQDIITTANEALKASERSNIPIDKLLNSNIYKSDSDSNTQTIKTPSTIVSSDGDKDFLPPKLSPIESNYKNEQNPNLKIVSKILKMDNS